MINHIFMAQNGVVHFLARATEGTLIQGSLCQLVSELVNECVRACMRACVRAYLFFGEASKASDIVNILTSDSGSGTLLI